MVDAPSELDEADDVDESERVELVLSADAQGERLDRALSQAWAQASSAGPNDAASPPMANVSRTTLQRWIEEGHVRLDGEVATRRTRARAEARVVIEIAPPAPSEAIPEDLPLAILYEDEHLLIVDKAAGMVVHPAPGHATGTLVNAVLFHCGATEPGEGVRPGIVHRLDKGTSGVMVVAKTAAAKEGLVTAFSAHAIERLYVAIATGALPEATTYDTLHGRHPTDRKRFSSRVERGKRAITHVRRLRALHGASLVECRLETGRTHQIRVHLADAGHALVGDPVYGRPSRDPLLRQAAALLERQALHAAVLGLRHPITGAWLRYETEPPEDFVRARELLVTSG